jgi:hypothetical protein
MGIVLILLVGHYFSTEILYWRFYPAKYDYYMYYSGHGILANIFLTFLKKNDVNQSLVPLINDNY